ncbi:MAG: hypothetical protein EOM72_05510 [Opitutae bacterium]|nr:hypothetical protein [Opitutae bacterium]
MVHVEKVTEAMTPEILGLLAGFHSEEASRKPWRKALTYAWRFDEGYRGLALVDGGKVAGFLGLLFSTRQIGGAVHRFCNLYGWIVRPEYRNHSLSLLFPVLRLKEHTLTNLTSYAEGVPIMKRLGFQEMDATTYLVPSLPVSRARGWRVETAEERVGRLLDGGDRVVFEDHRPYGCRHAVLHDGHGERCYILFTERRQGGLRYYCVHHVSQPDLFARHLGVLRSALLWREGVPFLLVDARYVGEARPAWSRVRRLSSPRLCRPAGDLPRNRIDSAYSEWILLQPEPAGPAGGPVPPG